MFTETDLHSKVLWARPSKLHSFATRTTFALRPHIRNHSLISWPEEFALLTTQKKTCQHNHSLQIHRDPPHSSTTVWARKLSATTKRKKVYQEQTVKKKKKQEGKNVISHYVLILIHTRRHLPASLRNICTFSKDLFAPMTLMRICVFKNVTHHKFEEKQQQKPI